MVQINSGKNGMVIIGGQSQKQQCTEWSNYLVADWACEIITVR